MPKVTLIGGGPVGAMTACFLSQRGFDVEMYERRADMRTQDISAGKSINLALSHRGLRALRALQLENEVMNLTVPMKGRMIHSLNGELTFQPYGVDESQCIYSISRGELNKLLLNKAEQLGRTKIVFNTRVSEVDLENRELTIESELSVSPKKASFEYCVGADGSASVLRDAISKQAHSQVSSQLLNYGYKELIISRQSSGVLTRNALHIWPRHNFMFIALPNLEGSFTATLFLPFAGEFSFSQLNRPDDVRMFFKTHFPDIQEQLPNLELDFFAHPTGQMVTVKADRWNFENSALLIGDAAHAIVPFFGQGMNCGFEDCTELERVLNEGLSFEKAVIEFGRLRQVNTDAIADMAIENFEEMRDKVADPIFLFKKKIEKLLLRDFPERYFSRYALVTFTQVPYEMALEVGVAAERVLDSLASGLSTAEQYDKSLASKLLDEWMLPIDKRFAPRKGL